MQCFSRRELSRKLTDGQLTKRNTEPTERKAEQTERYCVAYCRLRRRNGLVAVIIAFGSIAGACSGEATTAPADSSSSDDVSESDDSTDEFTEFWGRTYTVESVDPPVPGFDPANTNAVWRFGRPGKDRTILVDSGCNEITAFNFEGDDLSRIEAELEQTLKQCLEPEASLETLFNKLLRGPADLTVTQQDPPILTIALDGTAVVLIAG